MSNKNWYILFTTANILITIIGYHHVLTGEAQIVEPRELDVDIQTAGYVPVLGEDIEISVYLYNDRFTPVRIAQGGLPVSSPVWIQSPLSNDSTIHYIRCSSAVVPARSRIIWGQTTFKPVSTGTFTIEYLGERVTVRVVFQDEDATF